MTRSGRPHNPSSAADCPRTNPVGDETVARRGAGWQRKVRWLTHAGLADFAGAIGPDLSTSGAIVPLADGAGSSAPMRQLPLSLIPIFAVPAFIILHLMALIKLRREG